LKNRFSNGFLSVVDIPSDTIQGVEACQGILASLFLILWLLTAIAKIMFGFLGPT
jgi:hypothetical protein